MTPLLAPHGSSPALIKRANIFKNFFVDIFNILNIIMFDNYSIFFKIRG